MDIHLHNVSKVFGQVQALKPVTLSIRSGQFTTLLGPSGCGKTTLLRIIAGLESPDSGELYFNDKLVFSALTRYDLPTHKRKLGMVFQDFALWPHLTVFENVAFGLRASGDTKNLQEKVFEAVRAVRLQGLEKRYPGELSGGQQQRVSFARAIAIRPQLILFDEPLSALDAVLREEMRIELMSLVHNLGLTALYVTHDQIEAMSMSDQVIVMQAGEVCQMGSPEFIYAKPQHQDVARFVGKSNWLADRGMMFRPEHLKWNGTENDVSWSAIVRSVSYLGDRYEVIVESNENGNWFGYHSKRLEIGKEVHVYVNPNQIHFVDNREALLI